MSGEVVVVADEIVTVVSVGTQGPPGPGLASTDQLPEGTVHRYDRHYEQAFTNQSTVTVNHNLNKKPAITVIDSAGDECEGEVVHTNANTLTVSFSASFSGTVLCN